MTKHQQVDNWIPILPDDCRIELPSKTGKPSRTTFNLSREAHEAFEWLQRVLNKGSHQDLFEWLLFSNKVTDFILANISPSVSAGNPKRRKSYVATDKSILKLSKLADENNFSRDDLLSWLLTLWRTMIEVQIEQEKKRMAHALELIRDFAKKGYDIKDTLDPDLHEGFRCRFNTVMTILDNFVGEVEESIKTGEYIDSEKI